MRVVLDEGLFESHPDTDEAGLITLIRLAGERRHLILLRPAFRDDEDRDLPRWSWLKEHMKRLRDQLVGYLRLSQQAAATSNPKAPSITVIPGAHSDWAAGRLTVEDALQVLHWPLAVLLEHKDHDLKLLLAMCDAVQRDELETAIARGWARPDHGGGIDGLQANVVGWIEGGAGPISQVARLRSWLMFDRDAANDDPLKPSSVSERLAADCLSDALKHPFPLRFFQLSRRSIESYLPTEVLEARDGATQPGSARAARLAALKELRDHHPEASFSLSVKEGLVKDAALEKRERGALKTKWDATRSDDEREELLRGVADRLPTAWRDLPKPLGSSLLFGFGERSAALFDRQSDPDWESWFDREWRRGPADQPARADVINGLLEMI